MKMPHIQKILVIDDNETDRYIAKRLFQKNNFAIEIVVLEGAKVALEYLESLEKTPNELPSIIFLDIRMPEMDGFGFLDAFDKLAEVVKSSCTIMMLSTSMDPRDHQRAKENPYVSHFLDKPLNKERMRQLEEEFGIR